MTFPHFSSSSRAGDAFTGRTRASYQAREPIEDDEEGLAMKRAGMPPPLSRRVPNLRIRDDRALQDFSQIRTRCSVLHLMMLTHKHGLITVVLSHRQRTSAAFSSTIWVLLTGRVNSENQRTVTSYHQR